MIMRGSLVSWLFVSTPRDCLFLLVPLWGALPLLIYVEVVVYMTRPSWISVGLKTGGSRVGGPELCV